MDDLDSISIDMAQNTLKTSDNLQRDNRNHASYNIFNHNIVFY